MYLYFIYRKEQMNDRNNSPVFLIVLILSILIMVAGVVFIAKKNSETVKQVTQQNQVGENAAENVQDFLQDVNSNMQEGYDALDQGLDGVL